MGLIRRVRIGVFAARVANALLDIGIDINKFHPMLTDCLFQLEHEEYKQKSPHETAVLFLLTYMQLLYSRTFLFSRSLPELVANAEAVLHLWVRKGKMRADVADHYIAKLREKLQASLVAAADIADYLSSGDSPLRRSQG